MGTWLQIALAQRETEKSDEYSFGVVLLEVLTGKHPLDSIFSGESNLVQWVQGHLQRQDDLSEILDEVLRGRLVHTHEAREMLQVMDVSLQCTRKSPFERLKMKDVVLNLTEIRP
ncbi:LRR receptor-like serine/threonine-protein kinase, partial [Bienertia sinuspersici]